MDLGLKDKDGKPIDLTGIDAKTSAALTALAGGLGPQIAAANKQTIEAAITPVMDSIKELSGKIPEPKKEGEGDPKPTGDGDGGDGEKLPAWAKQLNDKIDSLTGTFGEQQATTAAQALVGNYVKKHLPNLKPEQAEVLMERLVAAKPKDEAAVKALVTKECEALARFNPDIAKAFTAEPAKEEGEAGKAGDTEAAAQQKLDSLKERLSEKRA